MLMYNFLAAAISDTTAYWGWGPLNNRNIFPQSSGGWMSKVKMSCVVVSPKSSPLALQMAASAVCPHIVFLWCTQPCVLCWDEFPLLTGTRDGDRLD